jgi:hypothetical protein
VSGRGNSSFRDAEEVFTRRRLILLKTAENSKIPTRVFSRNRIEAEEWSN